MASAKFLEEALSTDVDESAVSAIVGSLENQLVTSTPATVVINQNHVNSAISNGGTLQNKQQQPSVGGGPIANGDSTTTGSTVDTKVMTAPLPTGPTQDSQQHVQQQQVKIVYTQQGGMAAAAASGVMLQGRAAQALPNGAIGIQQASAGAPQQQQVASASQQQSGGTPQPQTPGGKPQQPTLVIKTCASGSAPGLVTMPMNAATVPPANNQLTLSSFTGLAPGQQGHLLLKTENGQYQLLRVGPAPAAANLAASTTPGGQPVTFRMQSVPSAVTSSVATTPTIVGGTSTVSTTGQNIQTVTTVQRPANDNTKEKCRKFLANLLELSSKEPKSVERSVRTLIQELIDMKVEPEDFCDKLERLLNASPQPCLIGFLKKSLPLLRHSLVTKELTIDGIRPPPANLVFSVATAAPTQTQIRPGLAASQVRIVGPGATVVRPGQVLQQRLVTPVRGTPQTTRMVTAIRQPNANVIVSNSQPPALHPVYPGNQIRAGVGIRQPIQNKSPVTSVKIQGIKPAVPSMVSRPATKDKEKKSMSSSYTGDDDINDVAAMGGVNLAEETQKILGSTEFVGTQIRSCKEDIMCSMGPLQQRIRQIGAKHGLDDPGADVAACISHAAQERVKNLLEKLAVITEHRLEIVKTDQRYEVSSDIKAQLKFLEDLDRAERKRHEENEREVLLRAAKSRSKTEDPEQAKLKAKAKEMQRVEMEELRQREANATALQAIGPRKKPRLDGDISSGIAQASPGGFSGGPRGQMPLRQRMKKATVRDLQFLFENEKDLCKSKLLYKSYLK